MPEHDSSSSADEEALDAAQEYQTNRITRREALKNFGVIVGGLTLLGFGMFESPAEGTPLEALSDPPVHSEMSSLESFSSWIYSSSWCSECGTKGRDQGSDSYYSLFSTGYWSSSSSESTWSSWVYWWS